jgi:hypothetical protein
MTRRVSRRYRAGRRSDRHRVLCSVGARGFEPPTSWSRTKRATRLRYAPEKTAVYKLCCENLPTTYPYPLERVNTESFNSSGKRPRWTQSNGKQRIVKGQGRLGAEEAATTTSAGLAARAALRLRRTHRRHQLHRAARTVQPPRTTKSRRPLPFWDDEDRRARAAAPARRRPSRRRRGESRRGRRATRGRRRAPSSAPLRWRPRARRATRALSPAPRSPLRRRSSTIGRRSMRRLRPVRARGTSRRDRQRSPARLSFEGKEAAIPARLADPAASLRSSAPASPDHRRRRRARRSLLSWSARTQSRARAGHVRRLVPPHPGVATPVRARFASALENLT